MSAPLLALVGIIYLLVGIDMARNHNLGMTIVYASYAFGNVGFIIAILRNQA